MRTSLDEVSVGVSMQETDQYDCHVVTSNTAHTTVGSQAVVKQRLTDLWGQEKLISRAKWQAGMDLRRTHIILCYSYADKLQDFSTGHDIPDACVEQGVEGGQGHAHLPSHASTRNSC